MRRFVVLLVIALLCGVTAVPPAAAEPGPGRGRPHIAITGTAAATGTYEYLTEPCVLVHEVWAGTYDATSRRVPDGTFSMDFCADLVAGGAHLVEVDGTFAVTADSGTRLSGTVSGFVDVVPGENALLVDLSLEVTSSSGTRRPVSGTIALTGYRTEPALGSSAFTGTFSADLGW